jgi:mono/diheme cytochrome c family protein
MPRTCATFTRFAGLCVVLHALIITAAGAAPPDAAEAERSEFFEQRVRPVLAEHCFACHGPRKQEAGLRLDSRAALERGSDNGPVVDWKNAAASRVVSAIRYDNPELQMPPEPAGKLPDAAIADIETWLATGAIWPNEPAAQAQSAIKHWAFEPIACPSLPAVRDTPWAASEIDRFVLARLEEQGMRPAPPADRRALLRRATFDLIGLPPSEQELGDFEHDAAPDAFARAIDRLLESPHYGERWGRYWLDVARYGETKGYVRLAEERRFPHAFNYRDYVVRALNEDLPYDQFVVEQLAADLLPHLRDRRALAALGFLTLGRQFTGNQHDVIDDRIDVVSRGLLGLTVSCARCHDHKYDPISTADYYGLYGVFGSSEEPIVHTPIGEPPADAATAALSAELAKREQALHAYEVAQHAALIDSFRDGAADYLVRAAEGRQPPQQPLPKSPGEIRQIVAERWIETIERAGPKDRVWAIWHALASLPREDFAARAEVWLRAAATGDDKALNAKILDRLLAKPPATMSAVARVYGELFVEVHRRWLETGRTALAAATAPPGKLSDPDEEELRSVLYQADSPVVVSRQEALREYLYDAKINEEVYKLRNAVNEQLAQPALAPYRAHALVESPLARDARILVRGNPARPGKSVPRQFLSVLTPQGQPPFAGPGRLELARAIVDRANPLTARVLVNRVWARHFGAGLVRTPSNFGARGEAPSHPELLDYLATRFMDEGWSIKKLHRAIMLSSTYQQQCRDSANYAARDPENRLLWKMNRRRLDFEALRDAMLAVSGELDLSMGGPSVDLAKEASRRRTIYGTIDRQDLPAMLAAFDFASPDSHSAERYTTTVPRQALFLMNGPLVRQAATAFAQRVDVTAITQVNDRVRRLIQLAWGRNPTDRELDLAVQFVSQDQPPSGEKPYNAWESLAQALLLSNEFTYVD